MLLGHTVQLLAEARHDAPKPGPYARHGRILDAYGRHEEALQHHDLEGLGVARGADSSRSTRCDPPPRTLAWVQLCITSYCTNRTRSSFAAESDVITEVNSSCSFWRCSVASATELSTPRFFPQGPQSRPALWRGLLRRARTTFLPRAQSAQSCL